MKKVLAVILVTVMIAALIPVVSVATDKDPDTWLCDPATIPDLTSAYWMNQADPDWGAHDYEFRVTFETPNAFDGFKMMSWGLAQTVINLYSASGLEESFNYQNPGDALNDVRFSKAYAPGRYTIQIRCLEALGSYLIIASGAANPAVPIWVTSDASLNNAANTAPYIYLTGAVNPNPGATTPAREYDYWLCDPTNGTDGLVYSTGWWASPYTGMQHYYNEFTFNAPYAFDGMYIYLYGSWAYLDISVIDEGGFVCETLRYLLVGDSFPMIKFSRAYAPGKYTIRIATLNFTHPVLRIGTDAFNQGIQSYFVIGSGYNGGIPVTVTGNGNTNENTLPNPYIMLTGAPNPGSKYEGLTVDASQLLSDISAIGPACGMTGDNADVDRYVRIDFTSDIWFSGLDVNAYGTGKVNFSLLKNDVVLETVPYQASTDRAVPGQGVALRFNKTYAPGSYTILIQNTSETSPYTPGDYSYYFFMGFGAASDPRVTVTTNCAGATNAPAITLIGSYDYDKFTAVNASLKEGSLININFKTDVNMLKDSDDPAADYVTFDMGGESVNVAGVNNGEGQYVFSLSDLNVEDMAKPITAVLHRTVGGTEKTAVLLNSAAGFTGQLYFETIMQTAKPNLKALTVATLNYGAAAQAYKGEAVTVNANIAAADQTDYENAVASRTYENKKSLNSIPATQKQATWKAVGLRLEEEVSIRYTFTVQDTLDTSTSFVKFTYNNGTGGEVCKTIALNTITPTADGRYVCYLPMPANMLSKEVKAVIYDITGAPVSSELFYSVESYAAAMVKPNDPTDALSNLVKAMMRYGDAAAAYAADPEA